MFSRTLAAGVRDVFAAVTPGRFLLLLGLTFAAAVADAYIDRDARKGAGASDHAPVVIDLRLD